MLAALIRFVGFDRPVPVPLPPKRRTAAAPVAKKAKPVSDSPVVVSDAPLTVSDIPQPAFDRRLHAICHKPHTLAEAMMCMAKVFGASQAWRSYTVATPEVLDRKARAVLGDELHSYCRALLMTGGKLPVIRQHLEPDEGFNRMLKTNLDLDMVSDIDTWERAMDAVAKASTAHHRAGLPLPDKLTIPEPVLVAIATRQRERAERLERSRGGRGGTGGGPPAGTTAAQGGEGSSSGCSTLKGGRKKRDDEDDDEGSAPPAPPAGPKR